MDNSKKDSVEGLSIESFTPKKNCKKCHGTGRIGFIEGDPNQPYPCRCIMRVNKNAPVKPVETKVENTADVTPESSKNEPQASV